MNTNAQGDNQRHLVRSFYVKTTQIISVANIRKAVRRDQGLGRAGYAQRERSYRISFEAGSQ